MTWTHSLPNDTADIRIVDRTAKRGLEGRQAEGTRIVLRCQPDGLGDEIFIPNCVKVFCFTNKINARAGARRLSGNDALEWKS